MSKEPVIVPPKDGELLACPFCGSEAGLEHDAEGTVANWYVYCRDVHEGCPIGYTNTSGFPRRAEAAAAWNNRAEAAATFERCAQIAETEHEHEGSGPTAEDMQRDIAQAIRKAALAPRAG